VGANDTNAETKKKTDCEYVGWRIAINGCETGKKIKIGGDGEVDSPKSGFWRKTMRSMRNGGMSIMSWSGKYRYIYNLQICAVDACMRTVRIRGNLSSSL
jgi:hypothetical protein